MNPHCMNLPAIVSFDTLPLNVAPILLHSSDIESDVHNTTVTGIPLAPCDGESIVHGVLSSPFSIKLNTKGIFISPKARLPRQTPFNASASQQNMTAIAAVRQDNLIKLFINRRCISKFIPILRVNEE